MSSRFVLPVLAVIAALVAAGCERVPLLAPTESTITLSAPTTTLPPGGSTEITAFVVESAGTPVHNGTLVRFSATLGRVDPAEVETQGGFATTRFTAGSTSGTARIRATSGAATGGDDATNVLEIQIGGASANAVAITASPGRVPASGGTVTVTASAVDAAGNRLVGVPVTFSTTSGTLSSSVASTDSNGEARVFLTTNREATVTARVGTQTAQTTVTVGTAATVSLSVSPTNPQAGSPVTLTVTPAAGTMPRVVVNWGDGRSEDLGTVAATRTVTHTYDAAGSYTILANATADGETLSTSTAVTVASGAEVTLTLSDSSITEGSTVTATVQPTSGKAPRVVIDWGDGTSSDLGTITGPRSVSHRYLTPGSYLVTARSTLGGDTFTTSRTVTVAPRGAVSVNVTDDRNGSPQRCQPVTFTATATLPAGDNTTISRYEWTIDSNVDSEDQTVQTTGNRLTRVFATLGTKTVSVVAVTTDGRRGNGETQVVVVPETIPTVCS